MLGYNRPQLLSRVLSAVSEAPVSELYVWLDGPNSLSEDDERKCAESRNLVASLELDIPVHYRFGKTNRGCRASVSSGISWFFSCVDAGIILEDDCLPSPGFFTFADEMLSEYSDDPQVLTISGHQRLGEWSDLEETFHFSRYPNIWGWATWADIWSQYDEKITSWDRLRISPWLRSKIGLTRDAAKFWRYQFDRVRAGKVDTWDYQLTFLSFLKGGKNISPHKNFISNIGFGDDATHTSQPNPSWLLTETTEFAEVRFPKLLENDPEKDRRTELTVFRTKRSFPEYIKFFRSWTRFRL